MLPNSQPAAASALSSRETYRVNLRPGDGGMIAPGSGSPPKGRSGSEKTLKIFITATSPSRSGATSTTLPMSNSQFGELLSGVSLGAQLSQCRRERVGAAAVCNEVYPFEAGRPRDDADHLDQVLDRVLGGLAVHVVAEQDAAVSALRPGEDPAHELQSQEMARCTHGQRGGLSKLAL